LQASFSQKYLFSPSRSFPKGFPHSGQLAIPNPLYEKLTGAIKGVISKLEICYSQIPEEKGGIKKQ
jgi:hypothetical protein